MNYNQDSDSSLNDINVDKPDNQPQDTVSAMIWAPNPSVRYLAAASWDSKVRIYEATASGMSKALVAKGAFGVDDPLLSLAWSTDMASMYAGCTNNTVKKIDVSTGQAMNVGMHDAGVKDVYWVESQGWVVSLSFDKTMRVWDCKQQQPIAGFNLGHKAFCSDMLFPYLFVGLSDEKVLLVDFNNLAALQKQQLDYIDSPLGQGSQLTSISLFSDGSGVGMGSFDGRANLSQFQKDGMSGKIKLNSIMTFKCHKTESPQVLYPVHSIGFHPKSKYFVYTAGGEGNVFFWDYSSKTKIKGFGYKSQPVTKVRMSPDGALLAYALGYDWCKGIEGMGSYKTKVCCHIMQESELQAQGTGGK
jgi:mRNA export factor